VAPDSPELVAMILNAAWMVRHYARGGRMTFLMKRERDEAIRKLGLAVRHAFTVAREDQFEPLLAAICDGLRPKDEQPF
jgi:hypothetical protein